MEIWNYNEFCNTITNGEDSESSMDYFFLFNGHNTTSKTNQQTINKNFGIGVQWVKLWWNFNQVNKYNYSNETVIDSSPLKWIPLTQLGDTKAYTSLLDAHTTYWENSGNWLSGKFHVTVLS